MTERVGREIRMSKAMVEVFKYNTVWNNMDVEIMLVPRFGKKPGWIGPGFWEKTSPNSSLPSFKHNTRVYDREELIKVGLKPSLEYLWFR